jgi:hypothetical protein
VKVYKQPADAINNFTEYLTRRPDAPEREDIEALFLKLREQLPKEGKALLSVETDPNGSMVYLIDKSGSVYGIGASPIQEHPVAPSITTIKVMRTYFEPEVKPVSLKADTLTQVKVVLSTVKKAPEITKTPEVVKEIPKVAVVDEPAKGYFFLGTAAASGISAGTVGLLFLQARKGFALVSVSDPEAAEKQLEQKRLANISDGLTGVALITGGFGAYLFVKHRRFTKEPEKAALVLTNYGAALVGLF